MNLPNFNFPEPKPKPEPESKTETSQAEPSAQSQDHTKASPAEPTATPEQTSKHWTKSKTMWFNIVVTGLGAITSLLPYAEPFLTPKVFGILTAVIGAGNMILRAVTKQKITLKD